MCHQTRAWEDSVVPEMNPISGYYNNCGLNSTHDACCDGIPFNSFSHNCCNGNILQKVGQNFACCGLEFYKKNRSALIRNTYLFGFLCVDFYFVLGIGGFSEGFLKLKGISNLLTIEKRW